MPHIEEDSGQPVGSCRTIPDKSFVLSFTAGQVLGASKVLATVYTMRDELAALWQRSTASKEQLVRELEDWCRRAETSGIDALQAFSRRLRRSRTTALTC